MELSMLRRRANALSTLSESESKLHSEMEMVLLPLADERSTFGGITSCCLVKMCREAMTFREALSHTLKLYATMPFEKCVAESTHLGWPTAYHDDLFKHDQRIIEDMGDDPTFAWGINPNGTHTYNAKDSYTLTHVEAVASTYGDSVRWYLFQNGELEALTYKTLHDRLEDIRSDVRTEAEIHSA